MPPKRKSDTALIEAGNTLDSFVSNAPPKKKARVEKDDASDDYSDAPKAVPKGKSKVTVKENVDWKDIKLDGEDEDCVPVYDDCNEIRRKINALIKEPGFKKTHWLKEIGNINSNSFTRFMKASGPTGGAGNGTYYAAYKYFEKVRIATGKKRTAKRERNEVEHHGGFELQERRGMWVFTGR